MRKKVTIVGAGQTGATLAHWLAERGDVDVVLYDIVEGMPQGKALDLLEAMPIIGSDAKITGTNGWDETANSDIIVITSGLPRKPGMTRDDLLKTNAGIVATVTKAAVAKSPDSILILLTNPLDAMCHIALHESGFPASRVFGQAGILDTARFRAFLAMETGFSVAEINAYVLGGHGDDMVPLIGSTNVGGVPISSLIAAPRLEEIVNRAPQRRRRDRRAAENRQRVLRSLRRHRADDRRGSQRPQAHPALRRPYRKQRGRLRRQRPVSGIARHDRREGRGKNRPD